MVIATIKFSCIVARIKTGLNMLRVCSGVNCHEALGSVPSSAFHQILRFKRPESEIYYSSRAILLIADLPK